MIELLKDEIANCRRASQDMELRESLRLDYEYRLKLYEGLLVLAQDKIKPENEKSPNGRN